MKHVPARALFIACLVACLLATCSVSAQTCRVLQFRVMPAPDTKSACVLANGKVLMRLRGDDVDGLLARADIVAGKLNVAAAAAVSAGDVATKRSRNETQIVIGNRSIITIDRALARGSNSSHLGLAACLIRLRKSCCVTRFAHTCGLTVAMMVGRPTATP